MHCTSCCSSLEFVLKASFYTILFKNLIEWSQDIAKQFFLTRSKYYDKLKPNYISSVPPTVVPITANEAEKKKILAIMLTEWLAFSGS